MQCDLIEKLTYRIFVLFIFICFTVIMPFIAYASEDTNAKEKVTVAYIDYNNFIIPNDGNSYSGYGVDYLNRIAQYTGWQYEFVYMEWTDAYNAVKEGLVDFYCVARQTEDRQIDFDFSMYPICNEEMNIYTLPNKDIYYQDYSEMNGKTVGMLKNSDEIDYFKRYADEHSFSCQIVEYPMNEAAVLAMENGEVDMIALVNYSVSGSYKLIGNFGVSPAYMMSYQNSQLMAEFSQAQEKLFFDDSSFTTELEKKYYETTAVSEILMLTRDEADYIASLKDSGTTLNVAVSVDIAPIEYYDYNSNSFKGLSIDLFNCISDLTGIHFNFINRENKDRLIAEMESGNITVVGAMSQNPFIEELFPLTQSKPFVENSFSVVSKDLSSLTADSIVAIPSGYIQFPELEEKHRYTNVIDYPSFEDCVRAVDNGMADLTYIISMCEGYLLDHAYYADLDTMIYDGLRSKISFGVYNKYDPRLISIINKCISAISTREINDLLVSNIAIAKPKQTAQDFIIKNTLGLLVATIIILFLVAGLVIRTQKNRQQLLINKKLQKHRDYLQHLYNTLPCGIFRYEYDAPHTIISHNALCAKIYGYDKDFLVVGATPGAVVESGTEEVFQRKFDECIATGGLIKYERAITRADGSQAFTESVMDIVETETEKIFQEVIIDITERKKHEIEVEKKYNNEIHRSRKNDHNLIYTSCFDMTDQILTETDIDVPGIHSGISVSEFVECLNFELRGQQSCEEMKKFKTMFTAEHMNNEYENGHFELSFDICREKDGQIQWIRSNLALRHNPMTRHLMCFVYAYDVTDECITELIVKKMAFSTCENFVSVYLPTGHCLQYSVGTDNRITRSDSEYMINDILSFFCDNMTDDDATEFRKATYLTTVTEKLRENPYYQVYATLYGPTERRQDKSISFFYTNKDGGVLIYTIFDVTEVRASEVHHAQLLSDALSAAEKADAAKSRFLSSVSHELRTPLNAIIGFIELAKDAGGDTEKIANFLASSDIASKQLLNVINDVLDMSSIESGKMKIANSPFNFRNLIASITNIYETQCNKKGVIFKSQITTPINDCLIGDELRVNQILMNLLGNAVKFTSQGHVNLTISQTKQEDDKVFIRLTVADTGCGMTEEMKERLFKPFEQESAFTARKYGGSGLGLSIVKNLVEMMNGKITVESKQNEGTSFIVDLPFIKRDDIDQFVMSDKDDTRHGLTGGECPKEFDFTGKRILLVEDNMLNQIVAKGYIEKYNVVVDLAVNGQIAFDMFEDSKPGYYDAILMDIQMPEMDGYETTKAIRSSNHPDSKTIQIIAQSADAFNEDIEKTLSVGMNDHVAKPIKEDVLAKALYKAFMQGNGEKK